MIVDVMKNMTPLAKNNRIPRQDIMHAMQRIYYGSLLKAKVLLGSATPSVDTYFNAVNNKYALVELNERYGGYNLPSINIVDI